MKRQLIIFQIGAGEFATDILSVREITLMQEITPVPETSEIVEGVVNLRGRLAPVVDLRKRMRGARRQITDETRIIIARPDQKLIGLIVDRAVDFIRIDENEIEPVPDLVSEIGAAYVIGLIRQGERLVTLIDLKQALGESLMRELDEVMQALAQLQPAAPANLALAG
jgi:purine-binding chemotaxis protein CheW